MNEESPQNSPEKLRAYALRKLTSRDCSAKELKAALTRRGGSEEVIASILGELTEKKWIDVDRYLLVLARETTRKIRGPLYLTAWVKQKQGESLSAHRAQHLLEETYLEIHGSPLEQVLADWMERKFSRAASDFKVYQKALQAALRRGFLRDQILLKPPRRSTP